VPANAAGWLFHVACRRLHDRRAADRARRQREELVAAAREALHTIDAGAFDDDPLAGADDTLRLLFLCCHPALPPPAAIALTLRAVGGLSTAWIARACLVSEPTMAQRISRAKAAIQASGRPFELPAPDQREQRLGAVLHVLYLMFAEGHTATDGDDLMRRELAHEAIRLARLVVQLVPDDAAAAGLLALLLLTEARAGARVGGSGELVPLDAQDRSRWDRAAIAEGTALVERALARSVGPYQVQAAIAALHAAAPSTAATDWPQILQLYGVLEGLAPNPMVRLNRAIAAAMVEGPAAGLALLATLDADPRLAGHFRLDAVRGHLHSLAGERELAHRHWRAAAAKAPNRVERDYLLARLQR
jgi:predicted RNA polymerase sigma factor